MVLGIDIGGTNIKFGIVDESNIVKKISIETPKRKDDAQMWSDIISAAKTVYNEIHFKSIGIGAAYKCLKL